MLGAASTCLGGLYPASSHTDQPVTLARFLELSRVLTGTNRLDEAMGRAILDSLLAQGHAEGLRRLAANPISEGAGELASTITAAWYSGLFEDGTGTTVADLNGALLWNALTFTKPWGSCGGETGYWRDPPET
jgi:hypothetical protein